MSVQKMANVLLVGSGITGAATAAFLRQTLTHDHANITIWDKARGTGGRMSTSRCPDNANNTVDLGAQYITLTEKYKSKRQSLYDELQTEGILSPIQGLIEGPNRFQEPGAEHFVTPNGVSSLVKYFIKKSGVSVLNDALVNDVSFQIGGKVSVSAQTKATKLTENFDIVVITMPVPQILHLKGSINDCINSNPDVLSRLQAVSYSSRFALGLFFPPGPQPSYPWVAKYVADDAVRFMSIDQAKRGASCSEGWSMCVHSTVPYGLKHLEAPPAEAAGALEASVRRLLPDLPQPSSSKPQKWRYSQVHKPYEGSPGCVCISTNPLVILAGDAFAANGTFDGCLDSAEAVAKIIKWTSSGL